MATEEAVTEGNSAFFYGTLMHPEILKRVIGSGGSHLQICPALLLDYTRHQVKDEDYPAILPFSTSKALFSGDLLDFEHKSVRGSLVTGLTPSDIALLDIFEGDQYTREVVPVHPLSPLVDLDHMPAVEITTLVPYSPLPVPDPAELAEPIEANTYVWCQPTSELDAKLWSFEDFVKYNVGKWVGAGSGSNKDYVEVDRRKAMEGVIVRGESTALVD